MRAPCLASLIPPLLLAGCNRVVPVEVPPEVEMEQLVAGLRVSGDLRDPEAELDLPEQTSEFFARLDEIDHWLDRADSWEEPLPDWLNPANYRAVLERLQRLEPYFEQVTALLDETWVQAQLQAKRPFAYRTAIRDADPTRLDEYDVYQTPPLERMNRWVELLCADAAVRVGEDLASARSIRSLSQALDLLRLLDDGQMLGSHTCAQLETMVLVTLRQYALGPTMDPSQTRAALEPRLALLGDERRIWEGLKREVSYRIEIAETILEEPGRADEDHWLAILDVSGARVVRRSLDLLNMLDLLRSAPVLCARLDFFGVDHPLSPVLDSVRAIHALFVHSELARLALAINEYRFVQGDWPEYRSSTEKMFELPLPRMPCRAERTDLNRGYKWLKLVSLSRSGRKPGEEDVLLSWMWREYHFKAFEARDPVGTVPGIGSN